MIEKILDLKNKTVQVDRLKEMTLDELRTIREEIRLISNFAPILLSKKIETRNNTWNDFIKNDEMQAIKSIRHALIHSQFIVDSKKITKKEEVVGLDALWADVNITIAKKEKENIDDIQGYQFSNNNLAKTSKPKNSWVTTEF